MLNHMGEREYYTFNGWKRATLKLHPTAKMRGDRDIGALQVNGRDVAEWDGEKGSIYNMPEFAYAENPRKRKLTDDEARKVFDNYNAARQSESEAYLRTPKGEAERQARNAAMLARMRAKRNPTTRAVTLDDMNMAIRGLRMNSLDGEELRELIALHKDSEMFAGQVTAAAARHVLKSKQRVGLIRNPRKRTPAQQAATAKMLAANRMQNARRFPAAKSLTGTIAKIRRMHKNPKSAASQKIIAKYKLSPRANDGKFRVQWTHSKNKKNTWTTEAVFLSYESAKEYGMAKKNQLPLLNWRIVD